MPAPSAPPTNGKSSVRLLNRIAVHRIEAVPADLPDVVSPAPPAPAVAEAVPVADEVAPLEVAPAVGDLPPAEERPAVAKVRSLLTEAMPAAAAPVAPLDVASIPDVAPVRATPSVAPSFMATPEACPYLGLVDDPATHFMFAAPGHRCHADGKPDKVTLPHQGFVLPVRRVSGVPSIPCLGAHVGRAHRVRHGGHSR